MIEVDENFQNEICYTMEVKYFHYNVVSYAIFIFNELMLFCFCYENIEFNLTFTWSRCNERTSVFIETSLRLIAFKCLNENVYYFPL